MRHLLLPALVIPGWLLILGSGCATVQPSAPAGTQPPFLTPGPAEVAALGSVRVDLLNRSVIAEGWVNQSRGLIELLACGPEGKTHESVIVLDLDPVDLNAALLLLGLEPGQPPQAMGVGLPKGHPVDIWVEWDEAGSRKRTRAESLVLDQSQERALPRTSWTYTGAVRDDGKLLASHDQSLVATFWDPWALLNLPLPSGSDDEILYAHPEALPSPGTPVIFRFHPVDRR